MLKERSRKILCAIIKEYILTAEPVGSKTIATKYVRGLSPATIRNIMADLEAGGFLLQPHTSAGRIPTEKSFRFYLDSMLELEEVLEGDKDLIRSCCQKAITLENIMQETTRVLSDLTSCAGFMFVPMNDLYRVKHISFLPLGGNNLMVLIVFDLGTVRKKVIRIDRKMHRLNLDRISNYLNSIGRGLTLRQLRAKVLEEMKKEKSQYNELMKNALKLFSMAFRHDSNTETNDIYVDGKTNILEQPEFREDFERMKKLFGAFEEKGQLVKILDRILERSMYTSGIQIWLGSESKVKEFEGLSFVTAPYGRRGEVIGALGVIGPVRMNYSKIIPLVNYTAGFLSKVF